MRELLVLFVILLIASGTCSAINSSDYARVKEQVKTTKQTQTTAAQSVKKEYSEQSQSKLNQSYNKYKK